MTDGSPKMHEQKSRKLTPVKRTCSIISLGCPKNLIDSETMIGRLVSLGFQFRDSVQDVDLAVLNTCGFLQSARNEAIDYLKDLIRLKKRNIVGKIIVAGCLIQVENENLVKRFPEVDAWLGPFQESRIEEIAGILFPDDVSLEKKNIESKKTVQEKAEKIVSSDSSDDSSSPALSDSSDVSDSLNLKTKNISLPLFLASKEKQLTLDDRKRNVLTAPHSAYLKIADGCDRFCSYCAIPFIRGRFISKTEQAILDESKRLADCGTRELVLIAQETTFWGNDLFGQPRLFELLSKLRDQNDFDWIRVLYTYPLHFSDELISLFGSTAKGRRFNGQSFSSPDTSLPINQANLDQQNNRLNLPVNSGQKDKETVILPYIDIPLQHCNDSILRRMNRKTSKSEIEELLSKLREKIDGLVLRTTFIAGFPGETDVEFRELSDFLEKWNFERAGIFEFSSEPGTAAEKLDGQLAPLEIQSRFEKLNRQQLRRSSRKARKKIGQHFDVLIDSFGRNENNQIVPGFFLGRTYADAPDIDPIVYLTADSPDSSTNKKEKKNTKKLGAKPSSVCSKARLSNAHQDLKPGDIVRCQIVEEQEGNLIAAVIDENNSVQN